MLHVGLELLQVLEHLEESSVTHAVGGEDVARGIGEYFLDVVVLEIYELFVLHRPFRTLPVEEGIEGSGLAQFEAVLYGGRNTSFNFSPMRRARLKFPTVATD